MTDEHPEGGTGYLTMEQFNRLRNAVNATRILIPWLRVAGYLRSTEEDVRVATSRDGHIGLPPTWIAAEEISRLLHELNQWTELEDAANDNYGAWLAWEFTRETETAEARWPHSDRSHRINLMRCHVCDGLTLRYQPPRHEGDTITVRCSDPNCRAIMDEAMFAHATELIESENREREKQLAEDRRSRRSGRKIEGHNLAVGA